MTKEEYDHEMEMFKIGHRLYPPNPISKHTIGEIKALKKKKEHEKLMKKKEKRLNYGEGKFIEGMAKGLNQKDAAIFAGYSPLSASVTASRLMKKEKIIKELDKVGLTDAMLAQTIKTNMDAGTGIKATADTSLKAVELALKLKGHLQSEEKGDTNIQINDLRNLSDEELQRKLEVLQGEVIE